MAIKKTKGKQKHVGFAESFKEILSGVGSSIKNDAVLPLPKESWSQFLGLDDSSKSDSKPGVNDLAQSGAEDQVPHTDADPKKENHVTSEKKVSSLSGILAPGEWLNLLQITEHKPEAKPQEAPKSKNAAPGIDYHRDVATSSERASRKEASEIEQKFQQVKQELNRMVESSNKIIQDEFGGITLEQAPTEVKNYHVNFLDWLLITVSTARQKVEDSGAWLSAMRSKKSQRGYKQMAKSHGTSFTMSNERQVATQTG